MQITVNVLEHFSKEIHTYLKILNTRNMETEHTYIVFTYKGNFVQWCNILSMVWERANLPNNKSGCQKRISFQYIHTSMYIWNITRFLKCIWNTLVNTRRAYAAYKLYCFYVFRIKKTVIVPKSDSRDLPIVFSKKYCVKNRKLYQMYIT